MANPAISPVLARARRWWQVEDPSVVVQNEAAVGLLYLGARSSVEVSVLSGAGRGLAVTSQPWLYLMLTAATLAVTLTLVVISLRHRHAPAPLVGWLDLGFAALCLPLLALTVPSTELLGRWSFWAPGMAMLVVTCSIASLRSPLGSIGAGAAIAAEYVLVLTAVGCRDWTSLAANALSYPLMAAVAVSMWQYLTTMARRADQYRQEAIEATRAAERDRYRSVVHDASGLLRMLSEGPASAPLWDALLHQASQESVKLRGYLADIPASATSPGHLGDIITRACAGFTDLPLEFNLMLGADAQVGDHAAREAVEEAIATALHNIRRHAEAHEVVLHADADGGRWTVVITDDGVGFDPLARRHGYGIDVQLGSALTRHGIAGRVDSAPGCGTTVTLEGRDYS